ncbi:MAG: DUF1847 domain-containing protein [Desulfobacterales bacterium]
MTEEKKISHASCAVCKNEIFNRICVNKNGSASPGCPTVSRKEVLAETSEIYKQPDILEFARQASIQEAECYINRKENPFVLEPTKTRIMEIYEFADKMGFHRLGLAFCAGLIREAAIVDDIFRHHGFDVVSVMCKAGGTLKDDIHIKDEEKVMPGIDETMCNPIFQAKVLNAEKTDFNILLGLCVGHDSLFFKYADAWSTVLAVKDRVTGHNPMAAVYLSESYYMKIKS